MQNTNSTLHNGRYLIQAQIAEGGQATVYGGIDQTLGRTVAIKAFKIDAISPSDLPTAITKFRITSQLFAQITHPSIAAVYDYFTENGVPYLITEFVNGQTLAAIQTQYPTGIPESIAVEWCKQLCEVLHHLHDQSPPIIFRDLKPENIMLAQNGQLKLIDFGIARTFKTGRMNDTDRFGTPGYSPPEQYGNAQTGPYSDVYALGATLFHLVTGFHPGNLTNPLQIPRADVQNPRVSSQLADVINTATQPNIVARFQTTIAMKQALSSTNNPTLLMPPNHRSYQSFTIKPRMVSIMILVLFVLFGICSIITVVTCVMSNICRQLTVSNTIAPTPVVFPTPTAFIITRAFSTTPTPITLVLLASPTSPQLPTLTLTPTITHPLPTPVTEIVRTKTPNIQARIFNIRSCMSECRTDGLNAVERAPSQSTKIYTRWEFEGIPIGASYTRRWLYDGKEWARYACTWSGPISGEDTITLTDPIGLGSGLWEMIITVDGAELARHRLTILGNWKNTSVAGSFNTCYGKR